jgi:hypothetical protein
MILYQVGYFFNQILSSEINVIFLYLCITYLVVMLYSFHSGIIYAITIFGNYRASDLVRRIHRCLSHMWLHMKVVTVPSSRSAELMPRAFKLTQTAPQRKTGLSKKYLTSNFSTVVIAYKIC